MLSDLVRLISQASTALARLDVETLDELMLQAQALADTDTSTQRARHAGVLALLTEHARSFAAVLAVTDENLCALQRVSGWTRGPQSMGRFREVPRGLFQSFDLYEERSGEQSIWPRMRPSATIAGMAR